MAPRFRQHQRVKCLATQWDVTPEDQDYDSDDELWSADYKRRTGMDYVYGIVRQKLRAGYHMYSVDYKPTFSTRQHSSGSHLELATPLATCKR